MGIDIQALENEAFPQVSFIFLDIKIYDTLIMTWIIMALVGGFSCFWSRRLSIWGPSRVQTAMELFVEWITSEIKGVIGFSPEKFLTLLGSLLLFIAASALLPIVPKAKAPTVDVNTTMALATVVFFSVPWYGIRHNGWKNYFGGYLQPKKFMLPLNILQELSRTMSLAIRLFANCLSGGFIAAITLFLLGLIAPIIFQVLGILTGLIQAYVFMLLTLVYIGAAVRPAGDEDAI